MRQISGVLQPRADISGHLGIASSNLDGWGFVLGAEEAAAHRAWSRTRGREVARNAKQHERWSKLLQDSSEGTLERVGSFGSNSVTGGTKARGAPTEPPRQRKGFHELVLSGVPGSLRVRTWLCITGMAKQQEKHPEHYASMVSKGARLAEEQRDEIERDLNRTFPNHALFAGEHVRGQVPAPAPAPVPVPVIAGSGGGGGGGSGESAVGSGGGSAVGGGGLLAKPGEPAGRSALRRLLLAYAAHNENTGYCQALNFLGGMLLLLTDMREEEAFWLLLVLVEQSVPDFYSRHVTRVRVRVRVWVWVRMCLTLTSHLSPSPSP